MKNIALLYRIHVGDDEAFRQLYAYYSQPVYKTLLEQCQDKQLARKMLKSIFREVYAKLKSADQIDSVGFWLSALTKTQLERHLGEKPESAAAHEQLPDAQPKPVKPRPVLQEAAPAVKFPVQAAQLAAVPIQTAQPTAVPMQTEQPAAIPAQPVAMLRQAAQAAADEENSKVRERRRTGHFLTPVVLIILILGVLWVNAGLLMELKVLPEVDLGYAWFNMHVFSLF